LAALTSLQRPFEIQSLTPQQLYDWATSLEEVEEALLKEHEH